MNKPGVSYYVLAWQAGLMIIAGLVSVAASVVGYLMLGGGELLLQQALVSQLPKANATFKSIDFKPPYNKLVVNGLRGERLTPSKKLAVSGLEAERCEVYLDLWPWPPRVDSVHVYGMKNLDIEVEPGFFQEPQAKDRKAPSFPIHLHDITAGVKVGNYPRLLLEDCGGELEPGASGNVKGRFGLTRLNGKPFQFSIESLGGNRWTASGENLEIDTKSLHMPGGLQEAPMDPVSMLLGALLVGEAGAQGTISSLRVSVEPPLDDSRPFSCEGEIAYKNLSLRLPPRGAPAAVAVPKAMDWMFFGRKSLCPAWVMPDEITTGADGRLTFHMHGKRLEFACDEGRGSAFVVKAGRNTFEPLESLKGSIVTDDQYVPREVILRGFLGPNYQVEWRIERGKGGARTFDLNVQPRVSGVAATTVDAVPLWRFHAFVEDYSELPQKENDAAIVRFQVEFSSQDFPVSPLLPPGVRDVKGRLFVRGRYARDRILWLDDVTWKKGALRYGGPGPALGDINKLLYGNLFAGMERMWGGESSEWWLQDLEVSGKARVEYNEKNDFSSAWVWDWKISSGSVTYKGVSTDLGAEGLSVDGYYHPGGKEKPEMFFVAGPKDENNKRKWTWTLQGDWQEGMFRELRFLEQDVPLKLHPERDQIDGKFIRGLFSKTVTRTTRVKLGETLERSVEP